MEFISTLPVWLLAVVIFLLRLTDVSMATVRVISVLHGRIKLSMVLGFFEVLIWLIAVSQAIRAVEGEPLLGVAYAGGFAAGNAVGIQLDRRLALGSTVILMISQTKGQEIAWALREKGHKLTTMAGEGRDGPRTLLYVTTARRNLRSVLRTAQTVDPELFYAVDHCSETTHVSPAESALGWRAFFKRK